MGVVAPDPASGYCICPPCPLSQSRCRNGLGLPFILRSWALPSQGLRPSPTPASCPHIKDQR